MLERSEGSSFAAAAEVSDTVKRSLREAVILMHQNNYVHGDLRQQHILNVNDKVHIVDFDWADAEDPPGVQPLSQTKCRPSRSHVCLCQSGETGLYLYRLSTGCRTPVRTTVTFLTILGGAVFVAAS